MSYTKLSNDVAACDVATKKTLARGIGGFSWDATLGGISDEVANRVRERELREAHQRYAAKLKRKAAYKALPKSVRERKVREARSVKQAMVEEQAYATPSIIATGLMAVGVTAAVYAASRSLKRSLKKADAMTTSANALLEELKATLMGFKSTVEKAAGHLWMLPFVFLAIWVCQQLANDLVRTLVFTAFSFVLGPVWDTISHLMPYKVQQQSGDTSIGAIIATLMTVTYLPQRGERLVPEIMKRLSVLPRASEGLEVFFKSCVSVAEDVINIVLSYFSETRVSFADHTTRTVREWIKEAEELHISLFETIRGTPEQSILVAAQAKIVDGYQLKTVVSEERLKLAIQRAIDKLEIAMRPYAGAVNAIRTFRQEPIFALFLGKSKQGKTSLVTRVGTTILMLAGLVTPAEALQHLWQKGDTKYYESYFGQKCMVMDDCFQEKAKAGMETNEFLQIIRMVGNWSCPLNMASLEVKGKFFFNSPLILGTTNCNKITDTCAAEVIHEPAAVARRIHHALEIKATGEYEVAGGLNYSLFEAEIERRAIALLARMDAGEQLTQLDIMSMVPWEAWAVQPRNFADGEPIGGLISLRDWVIYTARDLKRKQAQHEGATKNIMQYTELLARVQPIDLENYVPTAQPEGFFWKNPARTRELQERRSAIEHQEMMFNAADGIADDGALSLQGQSHEEFIQWVRSSSGHWHNGLYTKPDDWTDAEYARWTVQLSTLRLQYQQCYAALDEERVYFTEMCDLAKAWAMAFYEKVVSVTSSVWSAVRSLMGGFEAALMQQPRDPMEFVVWLAKYATYVVVFAAAATKAVFFVLDVAIGVTVTILKKLGLVRQQDTPYVPSQYLAEAVFGEQHCQVVAQSNVKDFKATQPPKLIVNPQFKGNANPQMYDGTQSDDKHNKVFENGYSMALKMPNMLYPMGQITMVEGAIAVMPSHFRTSIQEKLASGEYEPQWQLLFQSCKERGMKTYLTLAQFMHFPHHINEDTDVLFMDFGMSFLKVHRKIQQHVVSVEHLNQALSARLPVVMDYARVVMPKVISDVEKDVYVSRERLYAPHVRHVAELSVAGRSRKDLIAYRMPTATGMCGAPVLITDPKYYGGRCMLGIHVAGTQSTFDREGYAAPITSGMISAAVKYFASYQDDFEEDLSKRGVTIETPTAEEESGLTEAGLINGSFILIGKSSEGVHLSPNSKLKLSPFGEQKVFGDCGQAPAHLKPVRINGELKFPMIEGLKNYQSPLEYRDSPLLDVAVDVATKPLRELTMYETRQLFTFEQACEGIEGMKIKPINRATSPGFPYVLKYSNGKKQLLGDGEFDYTSDAAVELRARVDDIIAAARDGRRLSHICIDFLKDELRPYAKVESAMTRIISSSPVDYVIAVRIMFGAFIAACFRHSTYSGMCPGVNPYTEWWHLADHLLGKGAQRREKCFDGDFKRFDASEQPYMHGAILRFINRWYDDGEENARIRRILWLDLVHSRHLTGLFGDARYIVQWNKSLPSGHPLTTIVNSLYSMITLTACYIELTGDTSNMWEHAALATFGDDNLNAVDDTVSEVFNQVTVAEAMQRMFGLTYTSGSKDGTLTPYKQLAECVFLKRGFVQDSSYDKGGWCAPLDRGSFLYTSYYYKNNRLPVEELVEKLQSSLGELALHDQNTWDELHPKLFELIRQCGTEPLYTTRNAWRFNVCARDAFWF